MKSRWARLSESCRHPRWQTPNLKGPVPAELYIYWKVPAAQLPAALQAAHSLQSDLQLRHPALGARLLTRADVAGAVQATLMEIYSHPSGVGEALQREIHVLAADHLAPLSPHPQRHVEVFVPAPAGR